MANIDISGLLGGLGGLGGGYGYHPYMVPKEEVTQEENTGEVKKASEKLYGQAVFKKRQELLGTVSAMFGKVRTREEINKGIIKDTPIHVAWKCIWACMAISAVSIITAVSMNFIVLPIVAFASLAVSVVLSIIFGANETFRRRAEWESINSFSSLEIPEKALTRYDEAVDSKQFSHFYVITSTYTERPKVVDPWIVGQIGGTDDSFIVIAAWE